MKAEIKKLVNFTDDDLVRLKELRLKETEYTEEELEFMYKMHNQTYYRKENLQNPKSLDQLIENEQGENPGSWTKWTLSRLTEEQKERFYRVRNQLDNEGLIFLSDNMIMRCYSKAWDQHDLCIQRMHETEVLRLSDKCTFLQEQEFQELLDMNCIYYGGHCDT